MTKQYTPNVHVVVSVLKLFPLSSADGIAAARAAIATALRQTSQHTQLYTLPLDQPAPEGVVANVALTSVHPYNLLGALQSLPKLGPDVESGLLLYGGDSWDHTAVYTSTAELPQVRVPVEAPPPPPAPQAPPPPAGAIPLPAEPTGPSLRAMVSELMVQAGAEPLAAPAATAALAAPAATPVPAPVTASAPVAAPQAAPRTSDTGLLPDPSVLAETTSSAGRPMKSPFERKVEPRKRMAAAPWWWPHVRYSLDRLFTDNPATAVDPGSTGSGPVQAYAAALHIAQRLLRGVDGTLTVAQLRQYLREVDTGITPLPSAQAIYQLVDSLENSTETEAG